MKNSNDTIGNRTRDSPACSAVPQPTAPPRGPLSSLQRNIERRKVYYFPAWCLPETRRLSAMFMLTPFKPIQTTVPLFRSDSGLLRTSCTALFWLILLEWRRLTWPILNTTDLLIQCIDHISYVLEGTAQVEVCWNRDEIYAYDLLCAHRRESAKQAATHCNMIGHKMTAPPPVLSLNSILPPPASHCAFSHARKSTAHVSWILLLHVYILKSHTYGIA